MRARRHGSTRVKGAADANAMRTLKDVSDAEALRALDDVWEQGKVAVAVAEAAAAKARAKAQASSSSDVRFEAAESRHGHLKAAKLLLEPQVTAEMQLILAALAATVPVDDIPRANTPSQNGTCGSPTLTPCVLCNCTDPISPGIPDMRG